MTYQLAVHGGYNPDYHHFSDPQGLVDWLMGQAGILEVEIREV